MLFFQQFTVRLHGRQGVSKIGKRLGVVFLNQRVDAVAAGGNNDRFAPVAEHAIVFLLDHRRADGSLPRPGEAQRLQRAGHRRQVSPLVIGHKGRRDACVNRRAGSNQFLRTVYIAANRLGVLRTHHKAAATKDTLIPNNVGLAVGKSNGFVRTMANALIAVFTVRLFQPQIFAHVRRPRNSVISPG